LNFEFHHFIHPEASPLRAVLVLGLTSVFEDVE
jgi:hypothetical protein